MLPSRGPRRSRGVPGALFPPLLLLPTLPMLPTMLPTTTSLPRHLFNSPTCEPRLQHGYHTKIALFNEKKSRRTSPKEGGLGGQSLPELGRGSLPEENQLSRQLSQFENWSAVAARVRHDGADSVEVAPAPGSRATDTQGSMAPWYMDEQLPPWLRLLEPEGERSKATSFSWNEIDDSERLSGEAVLLWAQVVWWTITMARSISRPGLRDLLRLLLRLPPPTLLHWFALLPCG